MRPDSRYIIVGDLNDPPDSPWLVPLLSPTLFLHNALANPIETRPAKHEADGYDPLTSAWTYRHKESGQPPQHYLYDQLWLIEELVGKQIGAFIDRRTKHGGDGSDHDPSWIELKM